MYLSIHNDTSSIVLQLLRINNVLLSLSLGAEQQLKVLGDSAQAAAGQEVGDVHESAAASGRAGERDRGVRAALQDDWP